MIGVKPKKKKQSEGIDFDLQEGQAAIYGSVTERSVIDNTLQAANNVLVSVYTDGVLVAFNQTNQEGIYHITALDAPENYTVEFVKDVTRVVPEFSIASREAKEINMELLTNDL
jgi:uncharacterized membrane protein